MDLPFTLNKHWAQLIESFVHSRSVCPKGGAFHLGGRRIQEPPGWLWLMARVSQPHVADLMA